MTRDDFSKIQTWEILRYRFVMNLFSQKQGSKVNGLGQSLKPFWANCLLQFIPPDVGGDYREGWYWGELPLVPKKEKAEAFGLKLISLSASVPKTWPPSQSPDDPGFSVLVPGLDSCILLGRFSHKDSSLVSQPPAFFKVFLDGFWLAGKDGDRHFTRSVLFGMHLMP